MPKYRAVEQSEDAYIIAKLPSGGGGNGHTYTGLETDTAKTTVNNNSDTIKVDVTCLDSYSLVTETGNKLGLSLDETTYVLTVALYNKNDVLLSSKTVDLPIESLVKSGRYDATKKAIILVLQSGQEIEVPVSDLVTDLATKVEVQAEANTRATADATLQTNIDAKQDALTAGTNISIDNNVISAADTVYTAGAGITINDKVIAIDSNSGIAIYDDRIADANDWLTNGYTKTRNVSEEYPTATANLPAVCTGSDRWGVLLYVAENNENKAGLQQYFPIDGTYKGRVFYRSVTGWGPGIDPDFGEWELVPWYSEKQNVLTAGTSIQITDNVISASVTKDQVGLGNVDNTSDLDKPISTATQTALDTKSTVAVSASGTATDEVQYITIDGTEKKLPSGVTYTAGTNVSIDNNIISAVDTKLATAITLGKEVTASQTVGGITSGTVYSADTTIAKIIEDLLGGSGPTPSTVTIYYGATTNAPTDLTGLTSQSVEASALEGVYSQNIKAGIAPDTDQYPVFVVPNTYTVTKWVADGAEAFELPFTLVTYNSYNIYHLNSKSYDEDLGGIDYEITVQKG